MPRKPAEPKAPEPNEAPAKKPTGPKFVTFYSRYKEDVLQMSGADYEQLGVNKYRTIPPREIRFLDRAYTTSEADEIEFIRSHPMYGRELFEFGVHDKRIQEIDDAGVIATLEKFKRKGEAFMRRWHNLGERA